MSTEKSGLAPEDEARLDPELRLALATWPAIDPAVEAIVDRISSAYELLDAEMRTSLAQVGLTKEELKVLVELHSGPRTHGALCKALDVSTGAMTNRLDKLEGTELVARAKDPDDRRGVRLSITDAGRERVAAYMELAPHRERELLGGLGATDKRRLNALLTRLVDSLRGETDA